MAKIEETGARGSEGVEEEIVRQKTERQQLKAEALKNPEAVFEAVDHNNNTEKNDEIEGTRKSHPEEVVNALSGFVSKRWMLGNETILLDKKGMKHILERHHYEYWDGSVKLNQTFLDKKMSIDDVSGVVGEVLKQNRDIIISKGTKGMYQIDGTVDGVTYAVGLNKGRVGQLYKR